MTDKPVFDPAFATIEDLAAYHQETEGQAPLTRALYRRPGIVERINDSMHTTMQDAADDLVDTIRARPFSSILIALGLAFIGGRIIGRSLFEGESRRHAERYESEW